jgi:hypothetical protein
LERDNHGIELDVGSCSSHLMVRIDVPPVHMGNLPSVYIIKPIDICWRPEPHAVSFALVPLLELEFGVAPFTLDFHLKYGDAVVESAAASLDEFSLRLEGSCCARS